MKTGTVKRLSVIIVSAVLLAAAVIAVLFAAKISKQTRIQNEFVTKLETEKGRYDESTILLKNTSKYEAELLAKKLGARLRISSNGRFAVLYLDENTSIIDVCRDDRYKKYIASFSPDYKVRAAEAEEAEEENIHIAKRPEYDVSDTYYPLQDYLNYINLEDTWERSSGEGRTVAIIDTGIDTDHPEFCGKISEWSYNATYDKIVLDYDNDWSLIEDSAGHGTAVAGVIAAAMDGNGVTGIAPGANILVIKAECDESGAFKRTSDLVFGLYYAIERDVDVVNMSFALEMENPFEDALRLACDSDIICVAAAGNKKSASGYFPASDPNCIGVGSLEDGGWERAGYSNYGDNADVYAPGSVLTTAVGGTYGYENGTSFSSPIVAAAALHYKTLAGPYEQNEVFIKKLHASCYDLGDPGPDFFYGYGAVDFHALLLEETGNVTFNMMTDDLYDEDGVFIYGHAIADIPEPERLYAVFDGWYYDPQFTDELNWYEDVYYTDVTLYAKWANEDDIIPFEYRILDDGTVEILGYRGKRRYITIPDYIEGRQVSSIGTGAFSGESRLRRIVLPRYLTNIEDRAFYGCANILSFELPDGVVNIGSEAFSYNVRLNSITLGKSLRTVGNEAFANCGLLNSIYFPETLHSVDGTAFFGDVSMTAIFADENCRNFISVDGVLYNHSKSMIVAYPAARSLNYKLPDETQTVGVMAFSFTSAYNVDLNSVVVIEPAAFSYGGIGGVIIPDTCTEVGVSAFCECGALTYAHIGNSVTELEDSVFSGCSSLKEVFIGKNISRIGASAFKSDTSLAALTFEEDAVLEVIEKYAFAKSGLRTVAFPKSLAFIGESAFEKCVGLSEITFEKDSDLQQIGRYAFSETAGLRTLEFPSKVRIIDKYAFLKSGLTGEIVIPSSVTSYGEGLFASCEKLTAILIGNENEYYKDIDGVVCTIDGGTLIEYPAGSRRASYSIPEGVKNIYNAAFYGSHYISTVTMPDTVINVNGFAFHDCKNVTEYYLSDNLVYLGENAFSRNSSLRSINLPDSVRQISRCCFEDDWLLNTVHISENTEMRRIGFRAFAYCGLKSFRVPAVISSVAQYAFEGCKKLRYFSFAENSRLESISAYFFLGCDSIQELVFESGSALKSVQAHGLHGMSNLTRVDFGDAQIENIDNYAFRMCPRLEELILPDSLKNIGRFAFYRCESLKSLTVPEALEHIGEYAFLGTKGFNLYFKSELLPIYLDENWDNGIEGYYTGVSEIVETENWHYANLKNGTVSIIKYLGNEKNIDLKNFEYGIISVIGGYAFADKDLQSVILPDSLEQIQRFAFVGNTELESITIPENVNFIAQHAFEKTGIKSLTFKGNNVKVIEQYAFAYTRQLKSVVLPGSLEKLGTYAFHTSGIETLGFGTGYHLDTIPEGCFAETKLKTVTVPYGTKVIDHNAFSHNRELKSVDLSAGEDMMIMSNVFYNTGLTSVHIGANVRFIGEYAFMDLDGLTAFTVDENNPYYSVTDGVLFNKAGTTLVSMPAGRTGSYMIPAKVEVLSFGAFENSHLSEITIEEGSRLVTFGYRAFYGAKNLTSFTVPKGVVSIDYYAFAECDKLETVIFEEGNRLSGIYEGAFFGCRSLENITLPDTVVEISDYAFYACESLDTLPLSKNTGVLGIYDYAFAYTGITDLELSPKIVDIGKYAFQGIAIKDLVIEPEDIYQISIGLGAFADCDMLENITLPFVGEEYNSLDNCWFGFIFGSDNPRYDTEFVPQSLKNITVTVQKVFNLSGENESCRSFGALEYVETVVLPEDTYFIGPETFSGFKSLKRFDIPNLITEISDFAFSDCYSIDDVYFPDGIIRVGISAFSYCGNLKNIHLNEGLKIIDGTQICHGAFEGCAFDAIDLPETLEKISWHAFKNCDSLKEIVIHDGVSFDNSEEMFAYCDSLEKATVSCEIIGIGMFRECPSLETVILSDDYTKIEAEAFRLCKKLNYIKLSDKLTYIGDGAFSECESLNIPVMLPEGCTEIGTDAFYMSGISYLSLPSTLKNIGYSAFAGCKNVKQDLVIPEGVTYIADRAFDETGITSVIVPHSVTYLGNAFENCRNLKTAIINADITELGGFGGDTALESIAIPDSVRIIRGTAFWDCRKLRLQKLPASLQEIGWYAFADCKSICQLELPENLTTIDAEAFPYCFNLVSIINSSRIDVDFDNGFGSIGQSLLMIKDKNGIRYRDDGYGTQYELTEDGYLLRNGPVYGDNTDHPCLIAYLGNNEEISLNDSEYDILLSYSSAFLNSVIIEEATSYANVSSNAVRKLTVLSDCSFDFSIDYLDELIITPENTHYEMNDGVLYKYNGDGKYAVWSLPDLTGDIAIQEGTVVVDSYAFMNRDIISVHFPESLTTIHDNAFRECRKLKELVFSPGIREVFANAFEDCDSLEMVDLCRCERIGYEAFRDCDSLCELHLGNCSYIGYTAFWNCNRIDTIYFDNCSNISEYAFPTIGIKNLTIPGSVKNIGERAFSGCWNLTEVTLEEGVETIKAGAFNGCPIETLRIPASVKEISMSAIKGVKNVILTHDSEYLELSDGILRYKDGPFIWCRPDLLSSGSHVEIPTGFTEIPEGLYENDHEIVSVVIPEGVTKIGEYAFKNCENLKYVFLPSTLETIEYQAFMNTALEEITLPAKLSSMSDPFERCHKIRTINVEEGNETYYVKDNILYSEFHAIRGTLSVPEKVVIPDGITDIDWFAFEGSPLKEIVFPASVQSIGSYSFTGSGLKSVDIPEGAYLHPWAFDGCEELETVRFPASLPYYEPRCISGGKIRNVTVSEENPSWFAYDNIVYERNTLKFVFVPKGLVGTVTVFDGVSVIPAETFAHTSASTIVLPQSVITIGSRAFEGSGIRSVVIPDSVISIGSRSFADTKLTKFRIPGSVTYIDETAFEGCENLNYVENESDLDVRPFTSPFPKAMIVVDKGEVISGSSYTADGFGEEGWDYRLSGDYIYGVYNLPDENGEIENKYRLFAYIGEENTITLPTEIDGYNVVPYKFLAVSETVVVADGVKKVPEFAFYGNPCIKHALLPESLVEIGDSAFMECISLEELHVPDNVVDLGRNVCEDCISLKNVTLPDDLIVIPNSAFRGCLSLKEFDFPQSVERIEEWAFLASGLSGTLEMPRYLEFVGNYAFFGSSIEKVIIHDGIKEIDEGAFQIETLSEIELPDVGINIGKNAFGYYRDESPEWYIGAYGKNKDNWDGDYLYCGRHLLRYRGNDVYVKLREDVLSVAEDAFSGCSKVRYLELSGNAYGVILPKNLPNLRTLIINEAPTHKIYEYFYDKLSDIVDVPDALETIIIGECCYVEHTDEFEDVTGISIFVRSAKTDAPFDRIAPGWQNGNTVTYGDKWYQAEFYDADGGLITLECFKNTQAIRPPYVVLPKSGDTVYTHVGWDLDGDGEPDGMPASRISDVKAYAVVTESKPAYYTVKFMDMDRKTVIEQYTLEYGLPIVLPESLPDKTGYTFVEWENYTDGMTVNANTKIYSVWKHNGEGHNYVKTTVEPNCTEKGYTLHTCSICGDEFKTDYVDELWHTFGEWIVDTESTCSRHGEKHRVCEVCGFTEFAVVDKKGHVYERNVIKEPTCTENGIMNLVCSVCGAKTQEIISTAPHDYQKIRAEKDYILWLDAEFSGILWGCNEGKTEYWYYTCSHCGKIRVVETAVASSAEAGHRHAFAAILDDNGTAVAVKCTLCGEVECHEHDFEEKGTENGVTLYECRNCHITEERQTFLRGDVNDDGTVNNKDVVALFRYVSGSNIAVNVSAADFNGDSSVDNKDVVALFKYVSTN